MTDLTLQHKTHLSEDPTAPLVFLVHGRAGDMKVMWTFRRCIPSDWSIIAPQAPLPDPIGGFSWWEVHDRRPTPQEVNEAVARLIPFIKEAPGHYGLKPRFLVGLGFSQGSGMLSVIFQRNPSLFRGVAILAGFVIDLSDEIHTPLLSPPNVLIAHGSKDPVVPLSSAEEAKRYLEALGVSVTLVTDDVTHKVGTAGMRTLKEWMSRF